MIAINNKKINLKLKIIINEQQHVYLSQIINKSRNIIFLCNSTYCFI